MAKYTIIAVIPSTRLGRNGLDLIPIIEANGVTEPHEINFSVTVDRVGDWKAALQAAAAKEAAELESVFDL